MKNIQLSFIIIFSLINLSVSLIKTIFYPHYFFNKINLISCLGNHQFKVTIDLASNYTLLYPSQSYIKTLTILDPNVTYVENSKSFPCQLAEDSFYFQNNRDKVISKLLFLLPIDMSSPPKPNSHGHLSLNYRNANESYSLLHQLKHEGLIDSLSFSIVERNDIYFGGIPLEREQNRTKSSCAINPDLNGWSCQLYYVSISTKKKSINATYDNDVNLAYVTFTTDNYKNYAPKAFYNNILNVLYKTEIENNHFKLVNSDLNKQMYYFNRGEKIVGNVTFVIGDYSYVIPSKDFWLCDEDYCDFTVTENPAGDYWILGSDFLKHYDVLFDYERKLVQLYSDEGVTRVRSDTNAKKINRAIVMIKFNLIIIVVLILGIGIVALGLISNKRLIQRQSI